MNVVTTEHLHLLYLLMDEVFVESGNDTVSPTEEGFTRNQKRKISSGSFIVGLTRER